MHLRTAKPQLCLLLVLNVVTFAACGSETESKRPVSQGETGGTASSSAGNTGSSGAGSVNGGGSGGATASGGSTAIGGQSGANGALEPCLAPSIDRLKTWGPTEVDGMTADPPTTQPSVLVKEGDHYIAKMSFAGSGWGVAQILLANKKATAIDLSGSSGLTLTYSATADFRLQMRAKSSWSGGHHYAAAIPGTGGEKKTITVTFEAKNWTQPSWAEALVFADVLKEVQGFTISVDTPNSLVFSGFRVAGYVPACD